MDKELGKYKGFKIYESNRPDLVAPGEGFYGVPYDDIKKYGFETEGGYSLEVLKVRIDYVLKRAVDEINDLHNYIDMSKRYSL